MAKFIILNIFLVLSCINCNKVDTDLYEFDPGNMVENKISLSEIADEIQYIPLENTFLLSLIYRVYIINNSIYLSAKDIGILTFNKEGRNARKIGTIGRGPGEYLYPMKFVVDDINETVYVNDIGNKIKVYSKNGNFLRTISFKEYNGNIDVIQFFDSKLFLFNYLQFGDATDNWIVIDTIGNLISKKTRTMPIFRSNWNAGSGIYIFNNNLNYWNPYNDTVYRILPGLVIKASFLIAPGEQRLPRSEYYPEQKQYYIMHLRSIFETNKFLIITYFFDKKQIIALIEKKTKESFLSFWDSIDVVGIENNLDGGLLFNPVNSFSENNRDYLIGIVTPFQIKNHVASEEFKRSVPKDPGKKKELEILANSLHDTDNPVLVVVKLK